MAREFLGVGWKFPVQLNATGGFTLDSNEQNIEESLWIILSTAKGERVMAPDFGCGIQDYVFASNDPGTRSSIAYEVQKALTDLEPRIDLGGVRVEAYPDTPNRLLIYVDYRVRSNNAKRNMVYPFYLQEP